MQPWRITLAVVLLVATIVLALSYPALAQSGSPPGEPALSPYWWPAVSHWESTILPYAQQRNLDPDLIASIIWKESLGSATANGPVGAIGLMGVMPFDWRPSAEELSNPWTNVAWGARALAHTIRDGQGDLYYALAAYNGGWDKAHLRVTRRYATDILNHYTRAVAVRHGLPADGRWVAIFAVEGATSSNTITVIGPQRPLARYTERPWAQADIPTVPADVPPHATAITFMNEQGMEHRVNVWLVAEDGFPIVPLAAQTIFSSPAGYERSEQNTLTELVSNSTATPTPTPTSAPTTTGAKPTQPAHPMDTPRPMPRVAAVVSAGGADLRPGAATWWYPHHTLPAGTYLELSGYDPSFSDWVYVRTTDGTSTGWAQITDLEINRELSSLPRITPVPTLMPTPQPTPTPYTPPLTLTLSAECESGPLRVRAWDLRKVRTPDDWTVTIFIEGQGGNCVYTYAWEGEVKGELMSGPLTFDVKSTDRHAIIIGTASVTSAGETIEVGLFLKPPDGDD